MDLLGDKNQDMTLQQILNFVEAKESGKRSAIHLLLPQVADALAGCSYRKQKRTSAKSPTCKDQDVTCIYSGIKGHGRNPPTRIRCTECPAFGARCNYCGWNSHFVKMCRNKTSKKSVKDTERSNAVFDTLCGVMSMDSNKTATLDHHIFNQTTEEWLKRRSKSQLYIRLRMSINQEDYDHFGFSLSIPQEQCFVSAMADTGCQSCLAGFKVVKKLGLSTKDLIPVSLKMRAADNHDINILGTTTLRLSGKNNAGKERFTKQIVYVTNSTDRFFSREACVDLGIIAPHFPTLDDADDAQSDNPINVTSPPPHLNRNVIAPEELNRCHPHLTTIPSLRSQPGETPSVSIGLLCI